MSREVTRAWQTALFIVDAAKPSISPRAVCQKQGLMRAEATQDRNWALQRQGTKHGRKRLLKRGHCKGSTRVFCLSTPERRLQLASPLRSLLTVEPGGGK